MIGLLIMTSMLGQNAQVPVQVAQAEIDLAVQAMNEQIAGWGASIEPSGKLETCRTIKSSGDPQLDALACQAMSDCAIKMQSVTARFEDPALAEVEKEKLARETSSPLTTCVVDRRTELFRGLAESRTRAAGPVK